MDTSGQMVMALALSIGTLAAWPVPTQAQTSTQGQVQEQVEDPILEPEMQGTVAYVSGGIGQDELEKIRAVQSNYNLRLLFAERGTGTAQGIGEYLADIPVKIFDQNGSVVLDANARGPFMLISLPPGTYRVTATYNGSAQSKTVTVSPKATASSVFYWPAA